jgi:hypothetical protein
LKSIIEDFTATSDNNQIRNLVYVEGGYEIATAVTHVILGDGNARAWALPWGPKTISGTLGGTPIVIGEEGTNSDDGTYDFFYNYYEKRFFCATAEPTPPDATPIVLTITYDYPIIEYAQSDESIATIAATEGGNGIYEYVYRDNSISTRYEATRRAQIELNRYAKPLIRGSFTTYTYGFIPGQNLVINITDHPYNGTYLIQTVKIECVGNNIIQYAIDFEGVQ